ncbi:hypothetical protein CDAR_479281 [Caerostris darwini]|uniref:Uncharacterized protein n=1 Tax=Caerostris darwini TaxID=1538125 RepID=A0AAV4UWT1_9ARAC|nr:hypothetical protein CDAR_479281 [Caerostris darwini]
MYTKNKSKSSVIPVIPDDREKKTPTKKSGPAACHLAHDQSFLSAPPPPHPRSTHRFTDPWAFFSLFYEYEIQNNKGKFDDVEISEKGLTGTEFQASRFQVFMQTRILDYLDMEVPDKSSSNAELLKVHKNRL